MRKFRQALRFLQDFAREFCSGRKQDMKKDRRKGGPFRTVPDRERSYGGRDSGLVSRFYSVISAVTCTVPRPAACARPAGFSRRPRGV